MNSCTFSKRLITACLPILLVLFFLTLSVRTSARMQDEEMLDMMALMGGGIEPFTAGAASEQGPLAMPLRLGRTAQPRLISLQLSPRAPSASTRSAKSSAPTPTSPTLRTATS